MRSEVRHADRLVTYHVCAGRDVRDAPQGPGEKMAVEVVLDDRQPPTPSDLGDRLPARGRHAGQRRLVIVGRHDHDARAAALRGDLERLRRDAALIRLDRLQPRPDQAGALLPTRIDERLAERDHAAPTHRGGERRQKRVLGAAGDQHVRPARRRAERAEPRGRRVPRGAAVPAGHEAPNGELLQRPLESGRDRLVLTDVRWARAAEIVKRRGDGVRRAGVLRRSARSHEGAASDLTIEQSAAFSELVRARHRARRDLQGPSEFAHGRQALARP